MKNNKRYKQNTNKVVNEVDRLKNDLDSVNLQMSSLQREKDLKVDAINKKYENKIDVVIRRKQFIEMQMKQAEEYAKKNLQSGGTNE